MFRGLVPTTRSFNGHIRICRDLLFYDDDRPGLSPAFVVVSEGSGGCGLCVVGCGVVCMFRLAVSFVVGSGFGLGLCGVLSFVVVFFLFVFCLFAAVLALSNYISHKLVYRCR